MPLGPGESLKFLNIRLNRTQAFLVLSTVVLALCVFSCGVLWGVWGWNRANINTEEDNVDKLQKQMRGILREAFYVSVNGSDKNPGTIDKPWLTVEKAVNETRIKKNVQIFFSEGTFRVNSSKLTFTYVQVFGEESIVEVLNVTTVTNMGRGIYLLNVTNTLVPDTLVDMPAYLSQQGDRPGLVVGNTANSVTVSGLPGGSGDVLLYDVYVKEVVTTFEVVDDGYDTVPTNGSSAQFYGIEFSWMNTTTVTAVGPYDVYFQGCRFSCGGNVMQLAQSGNVLILASVFDDCTVWTQQSAIRIERVAAYGGMFFIGGGTGRFSQVRGTSRVRTAGAMSVHMSNSDFESDSTYPISVSEGYANIINCVASSNASVGAVYILRAEAYISSLEATGLGDSLLFVDAGSNVKINNFDGTRTTGSGVFIKSESSTLYFSGASYSFKGPSDALLTAFQTNVKLQNGLFIGNNSIDGSPGGDALIQFTGGSTVAAEDITIELTNISSGIILFENSRGTFTSGDITIQSTEQAPIEIADQSVVNMKSDVNLVVDHNETNVFRSAIYVHDSSSLILEGTTNLTNVGTCLFATASSSVVHKASATTTFDCGIRELSLQYLSNLVFDSSSTATLTGGSADFTTLGVESNTTTYYLGTLHSIYTDGFVGTAEGCIITTTT